jgi:hypothetical protein
MTWGKWSAGNALLQWLAQDFEDMPFELGQLLQQEAAMMRQGHLPRQGQLAASDHALIGDRVVGGAERVRGDDGGAVAGEAGDVVVMPASCEGPSVSSRPGRFHPHRQRHQLLQINWVRYIVLS